MIKYPVLHLHHVSTCIVYDYWHYVSKNHMTQANWKEDVSQCQGRTCT